MTPLRERTEHRIPWGFRLLELEPKPKRRAVTDAIIAEATPWLGPVERRDPATYQRRSIVQTWRCHGHHPRAGWHWTPSGSYDAGRCLTCGTPRGDR
jgi:hypothetical protein